MAYHDGVPKTRTRPVHTRLSAADRRASIIAAATEVFSEVGYQRGTMAEVARRVGVSEPVIFQNFGSKAAVFAAVIDAAIVAVGEGLRERAAAADSIGTWLAELLAPEHLEHLHAHGSHGALFADASSHNTTEPALRDALRRAHRTVASTLADLLARGQAEGTVRRELDPEVSAWWLLTFLASQGFRAAAMPRRKQIEAQLGAMTLEMLTIPR